MIDRHKRFRFRSRIIAVSLPLFVAACDGSQINASELDGVWQSRGYGLLAEVDGKHVRLIEHTDTSCLLAYSGDTEAWRTRIAGTPGLKKGSVAIGNDATLSTITFERLGDDDLAVPCPNGLTKKTDDPELNFEVLWQTFDRHYAFFDQRGVDWDFVYEEFRPTITKNTTSRELADVFETMMERLGDAHVSLYANDDDIVSVGTRLGDRLRRECKETRGTACNVNRYINDRYLNVERIQKQNYLKGKARTAFAGGAFWGQISRSTGYIRLDGMEGLASGHYSAGSDLRALEKMLDHMLEDIGHLPSMIIDVRFNGGGHDTVSVAIANRFADQRRVFGSKRPFLKGDQIMTQDLVILPSDRAQYDGKVAVLMSSETASAAEIFVMAMRALPNVTLIGTATEGILSDELYRTLPNGWEFSLSNEIYLTHDHQLFEATGVPPDVEIPFLLPYDLENGVDQGIETALVILAEKTGSESGNH